MSCHSVRGGGQHKREPRPVDGWADAVVGGEHLHPVAATVHYCDGFDVLVFYDHLLTAVHLG